jgi:hypothetical protein
MEPFLHFIFAVPADVLLFDAGSALTRVRSLGLWNQSARTGHRLEKAPIAVEGLNLSLGYSPTAVRALKGKQHASH